MGAKSFMLNRHVSVKAQNGQTKHLLDAWNQKLDVTKSNTVSYYYSCRVSTWSILWSFWSYQTIIFRMSFSANMVKKFSKKWKCDLLRKIMHYNWKIRQLLHKGLKYFESQFIFQFTFQQQNITCVHKNDHVSILLCRFAWMKSNVSSNLKYNYLCSEKPPAAQVWQFICVFSCIYTRGIAVNI